MQFIWQIYFHVLVTSCSSLSWSQQQGAKAGVLPSMDAEEVAALSPLVAGVLSQHPHDASRLALQRNPLALPFPPLPLFPPLLSQADG